MALGLTLEDLNCLPNKQDLREGRWREGEVSPTIVAQQLQNLESDKERGGLGGGGQGYLLYDPKGEVGRCQAVVDPEGTDTSPRHHRLSWGI